jgi:hypothetical protein
MAQPSVPRVPKGCILGCLGVVALIALIVVFSGTHEPKPVSVGQNGRLELPGGGSVVLAVDKKALDDFTKASVAKDTIGVAAMVLSGRLFEVPSGTKCLVIDRTFAARQVRIMEGDQFGASGWVAYEWVKPE